MEHDYEHIVAQEYPDRSRTQPIGSVLWIDGWDWIFRRDIPSQYIQKFSPDFWAVQMDCSVIEYLKNETSVLHIVFVIMGTREVYRIPIDNFLTARRISQKNKKEPEVRQQYQINAKYYFYDGPAPFKRKPDGDSPEIVYIPLNPIQGEIQQEKLAI